MVGSTVAHVETSSNGWAPRKTPSCFGESKSGNLALRIGIEAIRANPGIYSENFCSLSLSRFCYSLSLCLFLFLFLI